MKSDVTEALESVSAAGGRETGRGPHTRTALQAAALLVMGLGVGPSAWGATVFSANFDSYDTSGGAVTLSGATAGSAGATQDGEVGTFVATSFNTAGKVTVNNATGSSGFVPASRTTNSNYLALAGSADGGNEAEVLGSTSDASATVGGDGVKVSFDVFFRAGNNSNDQISFDLRTGTDATNNFNDSEAVRLKLLGSNAFSLAGVTTSDVATTVFGRGKWVNVTFNLHTADFDLVFDDGTSTETFAHQGYRNVLTDSTPVYGFQLMLGGSNMNAGEGAFIDNMSIESVPEPTAAALLTGSGLLALGRRRRNAVRR